MTIDEQYLLSRNGATYVKPEYLRFLIENDLIIDVSAGGLVQTAINDGISIIGMNKQADVFLSGQTKAWDYLLNAFADPENQADLKYPSSILSDLAEQNFSSYPVPSGINVIMIEQKEVNGQVYTPVLYHSTNFMFFMSPGRAKAQLVSLDRHNKDTWKANVLDKDPKYGISETAFLAKWGPTTGSN